MTDNIGAMLFSLHLCAIMVCLMAHIGAANVVLMGNNLTLSFDDVEATFGPGVQRPGVNGVVYTAEPLNACSALTNKAVVVKQGAGPPSPFALVIRGGCTFDEKVKNVQDAGFKAAIVYDDQNTSGVLVSMAGSSSGIHIPAVFISKVSGEVLKEFSGSTGVEVWIIPIFENYTWLIMVISVIPLVCMTAVLATCFLARRHRDEEAQEFNGMSSRLVKAIPSLIFTEVQAAEDNSTSSMCAICLEDYNVGEKLRVLPCRHKFHAACVDMWLMSWRSFCPVCKGDAGLPPASETTPLFSSPPRPINRSQSTSPSPSSIYSLVSGTTSYRNSSSAMIIGGSIADMSSPLFVLGTSNSTYISNSGYGSQFRPLPLPLPQLVLYLQLRVRIFRPLPLPQLVQPAAPPPVVLPTALRRVGA